VPLQQQLLLQRRRDTRYADDRGLGVPHVLLSVELREVVLLDGDAVSEEAPRGQQVGRGAHRVAQQQLGAHRPVEPSEVGGMPQIPSGGDRRCDKEDSGSLIVHYLTCKFLDRITMVW